MAILYESVPIDPKGGVSSVNTRIENACKSWGREGYTLKNVIKMTVESRRDIWEEVTFLLFEKVEI
jgi:hypothetical protein